MKPSNCQLLKTCPGGALCDNPGCNPGSGPKKAGSTLKGLNHSTNPERTRGA